MESLFLVHRLHRNRQQAGLGSGPITADPMDAALPVSSAPAADSPSLPTPHLLCSLFCKPRASLCAVFCEVKRSWGRKVTATAGNGVTADSCSRPPACSAPPCSRAVPCPRAPTVRAHQRPVREGPPRAPNGPASPQESRS